MLDAYAGAAKPEPAPGLLLYWCVAIIAGVLDVWSLIGWREINPLNLSWLAGDPAQAEVGWEFLRHEHMWRFPPTMLTRLDYPSGVSAANLDIVPLVGVLLRPLSPLLPQDFQYLGLYAVSCYMLQAYFGLRLVSLFSSDRIVTLLGALFFLLSPILTLRMYGHFPHSTHWILLACVYYYFRPPSAKGLAHYMAPFLALCATAAAITPYIALMANLLSFAALLRARLVTSRSAALARCTDATAKPDRRGSSTGASQWTNSYAFWAIAIPAATAASLAIFGFLEIGNLAGDGYTKYSMNILSPIDPHEGALLLKHIPLIDSSQTFEGYNYLGIGVLLLLIIVLSRKPDVFRGLWSPSLKPLVIVSAIFTVLALSLKVTFADHVLFSVPSPKFVFNALAAFRSSGRLFWPVHYLLILAAVAGVVISIRSAIWQRVVLAAALLLQWGDVLSLRAGVAAAAEEQHRNPLVAADWKALPLRHRHLVILPALQCGENASPGGLEAWPYFARLVARSDLTLNSAYLGRISSSARAIDCTRFPETVLNGGLRRDTAYVLSDVFALEALQSPVRLHYCRRVDGFNLCTVEPQRSSESAHLADVICPDYALGSEFHSQRPTPKWFLFENIDQKPGWGRWMTGGTAAVYFRAASVPQSDLRLDIEVTNANVSPLHRQQRAILTLNGRAIGTISFRFPAIRGTRAVDIPAHYVRTGLNVLRFDLPDAIAPSAIGIKRYSRIVSLCLHTLKLDPATDPSGRRR